MQSLGAAAVPRLERVALEFAGLVQWSAVDRIRALVRRVTAVIESTTAGAVVVGAVLAELLLLDVAHGMSLCTKETARSVAGRDC